MHVDGFVGPLAREPELTPSPDVAFRSTRCRGRPLRSVPTACALRAEDAIDLLHREAAQRIGLVHDEHETRRGTRRIVIRARGKPDLERDIPTRLVESHDLRLPGPSTQLDGVGVP